jgi:hypothetical protein
MIVYRNLLLTLANEYEIDYYCWKLPSNLLKNSFLVYATSIIFIFDSLSDIALNSS